MSENVLRQLNSDQEGQWMSAENIAAEINCAVIEAMGGLTTDSGSSEGSDGDYYLRLSRDGYKTFKSLTPRMVAKWAEVVINHLGERKDGFSGSFFDRFRGHVRAGKIVPGHFEADCWKFSPEAVQEVRRLCSSMILRASFEIPEDWQSVGILRARYGFATSGGVSPAKEAFSSIAYDFLDSLGGNLSGDTDDVDANEITGFGVYPVPGEKNDADLFLSPNLFERFENYILQLEPPSGWKTKSEIWDDLGLIGKQGDVFSRVEGGCQRGALEDYEAYTEGVLFKGYFLREPVTVQGKRLMLHYSPEFVALVRKEVNRMTPALSENILTRSQVIALDFLTNIPYVLINDIIDYLERWGEFGTPTVGVCKLYSYFLPDGDKRRLQTGYGPNFVDELRRFVETDLHGLKPPSSDWKTAEQLRAEFGIEAASLIKFRRWPECCECGVELSVYLELFKNPDEAGRAVAKFKGDNGLVEYFSPDLCAYIRRKAETKRASAESGRRQPVIPGERAEVKKHVVRRLELPEADRVEFRGLVGKINLGRSFGLQLGVEFDRSAVDDSGSLRFKIVPSNSPELQEFLSERFGQLDLGTIFALAYEEEDDADEEGDEDAGDNVSEPTGVFVISRELLR